MTSATFLAMPLQVSKAWKGGVLAFFLLLYVFTCQCIYIRIHIHVHIYIHIQICISVSVYGYTPLCTGISSLTFVCILGFKFAHERTVYEPHTKPVSMDHGSASIKGRLCRFCTTSTYVQVSSQCMRRAVAQHVLSDF